MTKRPRVPMAFTVAHGRCFAKQMRIVLAGFAGQNRNFPGSSASLRAGGPFRGATTLRWNLYNVGQWEVVHAMRQAEQGIFVPRKMLIWMIFASVFINVLFLLMGMVIGKEDFLRQKAAKENQAAEEPPTVQAEDPLALELSHYEGMANRQPPPPADVSYLSADPATGPAANPESSPELETNDAHAAPNLSNDSSPLAHEDPIASPGESETAQAAAQAVKPKGMEPVRPADPLPTDRGGFFVQVMASKDPGKVNILERQLRSMGYRTFLLEGGGFTRICIGHFSTASEADSAKVRVDREFKLSSQVKKR